MTKLQSKKDDVWCGGRNLRNISYFIIFCLFLVSCGSNPTTEQKTKYTVLGVATLGVGAGIFKVIKEKGAPTESELISDIDTSGDIFHLGGVLVNSRQSLHVTHWPIEKNSESEYNQIVRFDGKGGVKSFRTIINKEVIKDDLCILTFDEPLDTTVHSIMPIGVALPNTPTTAQRFPNRPWRGYYVTSTGGDIIKLSTTKETRFVSGDSGKKIVQIQNNRQVVVGLLSTVKGTSPNLHKLYGEYLKKKRSIE